MQVNTTLKKYVINEFSNEITKTSFFSSDVHINLMMFQKKITCSWTHKKENYIQTCMYPSRQYLIANSVSFTLDGNTHLSLLVKCHNHHSCSITFYDLGFLQEVLLSILQTDAVYDAFSLSAFQPSLNHSKVGRINTKRNLPSKKTHRKINK